MTPLLSIVTITYNHEPFIAKTIEGVLMQQVNFPIEFIIAEDCSTDGTRAICQQYADQYPELIRLITSESNVGAIANERRAMQAARGKYIAFCEGDDYWTDPLKLQKQVDFLESHPDYSVTFHRCKHYNVSSGTTDGDNCDFLFKNNNREGVDISIEMFFKIWLTQPLTMVYRAELFDLDFVLCYKYYRDIHQIYHLLKRGQGYLFAFNGGVRTRHDGGMAKYISLYNQCKMTVAIAKELYLQNKTTETKQYYESTLQWYLYNIKLFKKNRINYSLRLFILNHDFRKAIRNLLR